jgi:hypothetical protein
VNGSSVIDRASLARRPFGKQDCDRQAGSLRRLYLGQTTADLLHTTFVGAGVQLVEVCVTFPPSTAAFTARSACARVVAVAMSFPLPFASLAGRSGLDRPRETDGGKRADRARDDSELCLRMGLPFRTSLEGKAILVEPSFARANFGRHRKRCRLS